MSSPSGRTYLVECRFADEAIKATLISEWNLGESDASEGSNQLGATPPHGILGFAEAYVDGLQTSLRDGESLLEDDSTSDDLPMQVYFSAKAEAEDWMRQTQKRWDGCVKTDIREIPDETWRSAWSDRPVTGMAGLQIASSDTEAFGTGAHATTLAALAAMGWPGLANEGPDESVARLIARGEGPSVGTHLDLGTGSGILLIAGSRLWGRAHRRVGTDLEASILSRAARNHWAHGSGCHLLATDQVPRTWRPELITANMPAAALQEILHDMAEVLVPGGWLVLSGFPELDASHMLRTVEQNRLCLRAQVQVRGWPGWVLTHQSVTS